MQSVYFLLVPVPRKIQHMSLADLKRRFQKGATEVTGIDFGKSAIKVVRLHKNGDTFVLDGAELLEPLYEGGGFTVPQSLKARYAALALSSPSATAKLLTFPGAIEPAFESSLARNLGLESRSEDRMAYRIITEGTARVESRVLAAAIPEADAAPVMAFFATGLPAPCSLELAPLAALTAFEAGPVLHGSSPAAAMIDFGTESSTLSIFHKRTLVLLRRFDFGTVKLLGRVVSALHIDAETALNILSDNAFDISELITEIMSPLASQLIVSRDFVERRENCTLKQLHCIGGVTTSPAAMHELERSLNIEVSTFDPFTIPMLQTSAVDSSSENLQHWRFTAAIGAALAALQEES
jgi:Tfp pilus assembly PilM family ATPase